MDSSHKSLPGETGTKYFDGFYRIGSKVPGQFVTLVDNVHLILMKESNSLCPSNYSSAVCFWEGDLSVTFRAPNGKIIRINDHDLIPNSITHGKDVKPPVWSTFQLNDITYSIIGTRASVQNKSRDQTYLHYRITK